MFCLGKGFLLVPDEWARVFHTDLILPDEEGSTIAVIKAHCCISLLMRRISHKLKLSNEEH